ncbi:hypothetical protein O3M35_006717 [Rhynocoris fuscipes]|uniref:Uncharacterized protein n=1 Tax=Rhynocoris fuscipes TaxID=488301 RepID=A0AAW1DG45_9HEMI
MSSTVYCVIKFFEANLSLPFSLVSPREIGMRQGVDSSLSRIKSSGTDDSFKNEAASCGYSVVAVAHQMIAERTGDKKLAPPQMNQRMRRNSKSLPASPQTSPKLLRKNPYFTNIFFGSSEGVDNEIRGSVEELGKYKFRTISDTDSNNDISIQKQSSMSRQLFTPSPPTPAPSGYGQSLVSLKAKPSHLREMNFWSPTSM